MSLTSWRLMAYCLGLAAAFVMGYRAHESPPPAPPIQQAQHRAAKAETTYRDTGRLITLHDTAWRAARPLSQHALDSLLAKLAPARVATDCTDSVHRAIDSVSSVRDLFAIQTALFAADSLRDVCLAGQRSCDRALAAKDTVIAAYERTRPTRWSRVIGAAKWIAIGAVGDRLAARYGP